MATRLYFSSTLAAPITNVSYSSGWEYTTEASRWKLNHVKGTSAITTGTQIGAWTAGQDALDRQYVSSRMQAGVVFTAPTTTYGGQLMAREYATADNVSWMVYSLRIVSEDGNTVRATLRDVTKKGNTEFINNATHRNQTIETLGVAVVSSYTTVAGDRLVVEIGYSDATGTSPEASAKWGENATDLPVNETQTTDGAGWIEFSNTITFLPDYSNILLLTLGVG